MKTTSYDPSLDCEIVRYCTLRWDGDRYEQIGMDFRANTPRDVIAKALRTQLRPTARVKGVPVRADHCRRRLQAVGLTVGS